MNQDAAAPPDEKLDFKKILPIFVIVLVDLLGLTIIIPLLPLYATAFGANATMIGLLSATYPLMQFIGAPLLGRLSDRFGRKPVLIGSQIGTFVGFLVLGFANSLLLLFVSRIIDGISGANIATAQAAITDSTTEKTRTQGLGLIGAAFGLGFTVGPLIAFVGLAVSGNNYQVPAFFAAGFSLLSIILTTVWFTESLPPEKRGAGTGRSSFSFGSTLRAVRHPAVGVLFVLICGQQIAFGGFEQLLPLFTLSRLGLNASGNAILFVIVGFLIVAVQGYFIGAWSRRFGDRRLVFGALLLLGIGVLGIGLTPEKPVPWYERAAIEAELAASDRSDQGGEVAVELPDDDNNGPLGLIWLAVALIPAVIGGGVLQPAINSLITKRVNPQEIGAMLGVSAAFLSLANASSPVIGGALFDWLGPAAPFIFWGVLAVVLFLLARVGVKPGREDEAPQGLARGGGH